MIPHFKQNLVNYVEKKGKEDQKKMESFKNHLQSTMQVAEKDNSKKD